MLVQPHYWLELGLIDAFLWSDDLEPLIFLFILWNSLLNGRMMLLIT